MKMNRNGFSVVEGLIILGVIVLLGGVGYVGWKALTKPAQLQQNSSTHKTAQVITTKADLEAAEKALGDIDFEDTSGTQAESQASL
jgi:predicted negative regulator of RcsB-dependent stress response